MESSEIDSLLTELKPYGRLQIWFVICSAYLQFFLPMTGQSINFLGATPDHHCALREGYFINQSIPVDIDDDGMEVYSQCQEYVNTDYQNETKSCQSGWEYDDDVYGETIVTEWDLVCDQNAAAEISQSVLQAGGLVGALIFGMLADRYGRRPSFIIAMIIYIVFGIAICFSVNYVMFVILRFFCGFGQIAIWVPFGSNISEYMIPKHRNRAMNVPAITFSLGLMFMAPLAYLIPDWRYLQLAIVLPIAIALFGMWFLPESLRWLIGKEKHNKAEKLVKLVAKVNKVNIPEHFYSMKTSKVANAFSISSNIEQKNGKESEYPTLDKVVDNQTDDKVPKKIFPGSDLTDEDKTSQAIANGLQEDAFDQPTTIDRKAKPKKKSYIHLFKPPVLKVTIVISILRFTHSMIYFGFALSTGRLAGSPYLNFFYSALVEVPARLLSPIVYRKFRRTFVLTFCYILCGIGLIIMIFIPPETKNGVDLGTLINVLSLLGKFFVVLTRGGNMLLVVELYPTTVRNMGNGWTVCMSRLGGVVAPFMLYMDNVLPNFSIIMMAVMSILTALSVLVLPDTRKTTQPQDTKDLRIIMKTRRKNKDANGHDNIAFEGDTKL